MPRRTPPPGLDASPGIEVEELVELLRAGFALTGVRTVWEPPEELIAPAEEGEAEEGEWGGSDGEDEDGDEDHDFVLGG